MKNIKNIKVLLVQIRHDEQIRLEELASFARFSGLDQSQISVLNVFKTPDFPANSPEGYDAVFVGGASDATVLNPVKYPFVDDAQRLIRYCIEQSIPCFASCFGFQLAVLALGGEIVHDDSDFEMGTVDILLTEAAKEDPLFRDTPAPFKAVSVHQERAPKVPPGCEMLAYTDACCHSFCVKGKPFWAFQFHPEVDRATLVERLTFYKQKYTNGDGHLDEVLQSAVETPESNILVKKFVDRVLL